MAESPEVGLVSETLRIAGEASGSAWADVSDIWRHEGLKRAVETGLNFVSKAHLGQWALGQISGSEIYPELSTSVAGIELDGPTGIAPGWDKSGKDIVAWQSMGAKHYSVGGVTLFPQQGKPMPRLRTFDERLGDHGTKLSLNAFGFPGKGADQVVYNIANQRELGVDIPVIVQVTANKEFYEPANLHLLPSVIAATIRKVLPVADAIGLGLSSPNTLGMRDAQAYEFLYEIIAAARSAIEDSGYDVPLNLKGDGDGGEERLEMYCRLAESLGIDILELINTTAMTRIKEKYMSPDLPGGLAGADADYQELAIESVRYVYEAIGDKTDIIGVGGIDSPEQALRMLRVGASAVSINTFVRTAGTRAVSIIENGIYERLLSVSGEPSSVCQLIGIDTARGVK